MIFLQRQQTQEISKVKEKLPHCFTFQLALGAFILMSISPLRIEVIFKLLAGLPNGVVLGPVLIAILENAPNIFFELATSLVDPVIHLSPNGIKIHWMLNDIEVVWYIINGRINGVLEWADKTCPEAWSTDHALDQTAAKLHLLLRSQGGARDRDTTAIAARAVGFRTTFLIIGLASATSTILL